jgi:hypothetical protein
MGSRPSAAGGGGAPAPALRPADHRSTSKTQLLPDDRALLSPSLADIWHVRARSGRHAFRKLDAGVEASGPHDFAVRGKHLSSVAVDRSWIRKNPPCDPIARKTLPRPPHPVPNVRDDRDTPLLRDGMAESINLFLPNGETKYFWRGHWTRHWPDSPSGKSAS